MLIKEELFGKILRRFLACYTKNTVKYNIDIKVVSCCSICVFTNLSFQSDYLLRLIKLPFSLSESKLEFQVFHDVLGKYWNPERKLVDAGYHTLPPFIYKDFERSENNFAVKKHPLTNPPGVNLIKAKL